MSTSNDNSKTTPATHMRYTVLPERLPQIPRDRMSEAQRKVTDELAASRGSIKGPFSATMRCPNLMVSTEPSPPFG